MSSTNRGGDRSLHDFYSTPPSCVDIILDHIHIDRVSTSFEPCRGSGAIYDKLPGRRSYSELTEGTDYLIGQHPDVDLILTNPPFYSALEFLTTSLNHALTVVYLLRLNFLGSQRRKAFWEKFPPTHIYVLSRRPSFIDGKTDSIEYAWFVWDSGHFFKDEPGVRVI